MATPRRGVLQSRLVEREWGEDRAGPLGVKEWVSIHKQTRGKPISRLRAWDLEAQGLNYRLLSIYNWPDQSHTILAVVARGTFDYDNPIDPTRLRVLACVRRDFPAA